MFYRQPPRSPRKKSIGFSVASLMSIPKRLKRWGYGAIALLLACTIVATTPTPSQAIDFGDIFNILRHGVRVFQLNNLSDGQEVELGKQIDQQLKRSQIRVIRSPEIVGYVDNIGQRLARNSNRPNIPYTFQVVRDAKINAFATMGGFVYINAGLMLAAGLGRSRAVQLGVELALNRPKSRRDELEADRLGLVYLNKTDYVPQAFPDFLRKLLRARSVPTVLSTHPDTGDRIRLLEAQIAQIPEVSRGADGSDEAEYRARMDGWFKVVPANQRQQRR